MVSKKVKNRSFVAAFVAAAAVIVSAVIGIGVGTRRVSADGNPARTFYYDELQKSALAQKFYAVIDEMATGGMLDDGATEYDLSSVLSSTDIADYVETGAARVPVALGAARDAYYMDHPDLFYVDVYKLVLSAGTKDGGYVAYLDAGRDDNYYVDNTVSSKAEVDAAKAAYEKALADAVAAAKANNADTVTQIKNVNKYIVEHIDYDYGAYADGRYDGYISTAYSLVTGKALCGGYSRAFKAVMDRLEIPCVLVQGTARPEKTFDGSTPAYDAHMWNAVMVDGLWYAVDTTWNYGNGNLEKYTLVGDEYLSESHIEDNVISSSGFKLVYPAIRPMNYGVATDKAGFTYKENGKIGNTTFGAVTDSATNRKSFTVGVSYDGKDAGALVDENKYLAYTYNDEVWYGFDAFIKAFSGNADMSSVYADGYSIINLGYDAEYIRFAVLDYAPDLAFGDFGKIAYDPEKMTRNHILSLGAPYRNQCYGKDTPAPYVKKMTPDEKGNVRSFEPIEITLTFSEQLVLEDPNKPVGISVTGTSKDLGEYAKTNNVVWNAETNTVSFTLTPSKQYSHNCETYVLTPTNLVGEDSGKVPEGGRISFKMKQVICSKVFNDGRMYMQVFGQPQFVSASDESLNDFKDPNGQPLVGDQRSQLMLVINEPTSAETEQMTDALFDPSNGTGLQKTDVLASSTYQIDLSVCGIVQKVPQGSFMQVGFGFPEGYGPDDAGVTFTVYHYTRNADGTIKDVQAVPCVVSEYGIIATVKSFSPFMICAVPTSKAPATKALYAAVDGVGGSIGNCEILQIAEGGSATYTLTPDDGYSIERVVLNGKNIQVGADNKITLGYADLDGNKNSNILEVSFISDRAAEFYDDNNVTIVRPTIIVDEKDMIQAVGPVTTKPNGNNYVGIIVAVCVVIGVILIGGGIFLFFFLRKKKTAPASASTAKSSSTTNKSTAATKTTTTAKPAPTKPAQTNKSVSTASTAEKRPAQPTARPTSTQSKPTSTARPTSTQNKPASTARPTSTQNKSTSTARPTSTTRTTQNRTSTKPTDKK